MPLHQRCSESSLFYKETKIINGISIFALETKYVKIINIWDHFQKQCGGYLSTEKQ